MARPQAGRNDEASNAMTPPPSSQVLDSPTRIKSRTPTPIDAFSQVSTPPPTVGLPNGNASSRVQSTAPSAGFLSAHDIDTAPVDTLRDEVLLLQAALRDAKMNAAHHKLQYEMLAQESNAALERMAVEAHMAQCENQVIYHAEQTKSVTPAAASGFLQEGTITVQKDLYHHMLRDIQLLGEAHSQLGEEYEAQERIIKRQEHEIASLTDRVTLMRELVQGRTRDTRDNAQALRRHNRVGSTPVSAFGTPHRSQLSGRESAQPFAALLQASEMASQDAARSARGRKGHARNAQSLSHLPTTPQSFRKHTEVYHTPQARQPALRVPSTMPNPRQPALRTPDVYSRSALPVSSAPRASRALSEGTVSASEDNDNDDIDSEADTDIIEPDALIAESHASFAASQMLRPSQEQQAKRESFQGSGMLPPPPAASTNVPADRDRYKQTKLFGAVRKANVERSGASRPAKRARTEKGTSAGAVGLGIVGMKE
jgi:hypothetical protein